MKEIDPQCMSETISKAKEVTILGLRGTGYEGDILDVLVDGHAYLFVIDKILLSDQTEVKDTTEPKGEYDIRIVGHCFIEHNTPEDAEWLFHKAIASVAESNGVKSNVVNNKGRVYKIAFEGSVKIVADTFALADEMLLTAINAVVVDKNYDCFCEEKTTTKISFMGE